MTTKVLCILDGFGLAPQLPSNAFSQETAPFIYSLFKNYPWLMLDADGEAVGQESGLVGNSEVGHMNLGGLQLVKQLSYEITSSANTGYTSNEKSQIFNPQSIINESPTPTIHLIGLFSTGTIHSDMRHWLGALRASQKAGKKNIVLHIISDGRDSDRKSFLETWKLFVKQIPEDILNTVSVTLGSVGGRFYGMDRDKNFDRTQLYLRTLFDSNSDTVSIKDAAQTIQNVSTDSYEKEIFDEHIVPQSFNSPINKNDVVWLINFRSDRMKQLTQKLVERNNQDQLGLCIISNSSYDIELESKIVDNTYPKNSVLLSSYFPIFWKENVTENFSDYAYKKGLKVLHISETEKSAHVTYFFNGGRKEMRSNETFKIIPSHKVESHAQKPEMRATEITDFILSEGLGKYDYIIVNYANPDMVGHTGNMDACYATLKVLDANIKRLVSNIVNNGHTLLLTADHGNFECVGHLPDGSYDTEHNPNSVPCIMINSSKDTKAIFDTFETLSKTLDLETDAYPNFAQKLAKSSSNMEQFETWFSDYNPDYPLWFASLILMSI